MQLRISGNKPHLPKQERVIISTFHALPAEVITILQCFEIGRRLIYRLIKKTLPLTLKNSFMDSVNNICFELQF